MRGLSSLKARFNGAESASVSFGRWGTRIDSSTMLWSSATCRTCLLSLLFRYYSRQLRYHFLCEPIRRIDACFVLIGIIAIYLSRSLNVACISAWLIILRAWCNFVSSLQIRLLSLENFKIPHHAENKTQFTKIKRSNLFYYSYHLLKRFGVFKL